MGKQVRPFTFLLVPPREFISLAIEVLQESGMTQVEQEIIEGGPVAWLRLSARGQERLRDRDSTQRSFARELKLQKQFRPST